MNGPERCSRRFRGGVDVLPRFLIRRFAYAALALGAISLLAFVFADVAPGDFFDDTRLNPQVSPAAAEALRNRYGFHRPTLQKYAAWLVSGIHGDFGVSFAYGTPAGGLLWPRAGNTLLLSLAAELAAWGMALPWGVWSASRRGRWAGAAGNAVSALLLAIPEVAILCGLLLIAAKTGAFPVSGMHSLASEGAGAIARGRDVAWHLALPALALALVALPTLYRHVRAAVREASEAPFVRNARAFGCPESRLLFRHVLPAAASPIVTLLGFSFGGMLSASLLTEAMFGWPGLGPLLLDAILARDTYLIVDSVVLSAAFLLAGNLAADLVHFALDPRIRVER